jgi:L-rhamnonate dehydratase
MAGKSLNRRIFLKKLGTASLGLAGLKLHAQSAGSGRRQRIKSVRAYPVYLGAAYAANIPTFTSDFDPGRWRWRGPFAQLAGAIIVEIKTDQGVTGYGMGGGGGAAAYIIEHHLQHLLLGANALNVELLADQMFASTAYYGRKGLAVMAISGIDLALWDIVGKHVGQPVHQILGGATKEKIPAYYTGFAVEKALALGFRAFKIPIREGVDEGREGMQHIVRQLTEVRKLIGPDAELMIDCSSRWDIPYTLELVDQLADIRLNWIEEPLSPDDVVGYEQLCRQVRGPRIASGEHEYTHVGFDDLIRHQAVQLLQPDLTWSGGLTEARRIAALAGVNSLPIVPHRGGSAYGLAFIAATPNCPLAESFGILEGENNALLAALTPRFEKGYYYPNDAPGFGIDLNETLLNKYSHG